MSEKRQGAAQCGKGPCLNLVSYESTREVVLLPLATHRVQLKQAEYYCLVVVVVVWVFVVANIPFEE